MHKTNIKSLAMYPKNKKIFISFKKYSFIYILMLPSLILTFIFAYLPMPEQIWKDFSDLSVKNGATPETLKEINDSFVAANKGYLGY